MGVNRFETIVVNITVILDLELKLETRTIVLACKREYSPESPKRGVKISICNDTLSLEWTEQDRICSILRSRLYT